MTKYIVLKEHTLGYRLTPTTMGVLAGSVIKGGHNPLNGPVMAVSGVDQIRPATREDFIQFRVSPKGHLD